MSRQRMRRESKRRAKAKRKYAVLRLVFLKEHDVREIRSPDCMGASTEVSHIIGNGRADGDIALFLDPKNWKAACHNCGQFVEHNNHVRQGLAA